MSKNKHIILYPSIGLGDIKFSFDEDQILEVLGKPDEIDEDVISDSESVVSISYYNLGLDFFIEYFDEDSVLSIHSDDIIIGGVNIASLAKEDAIEHIKKYHEQNKIEFSHDKIVDGETDEESHYFDNLGITIWYSDDEISDICSQDPDDV